MILPVIAYGNSILHKKAVSVNFQTQGLSQLIADMWETLYHANGSGLAAPQVGQLIRLIVIDASFMAKEDPQLADFKKTLINPEILWRSNNSVFFNEGCLSIPTLWEDISRPDKIRIHYSDENQIEHEEEYSGFAARVIQHEYDHLEGILWTDHLSLLRKKLLNGKLNAISRGKIETNYKLIFPDKSKH